MDNKFQTTREVVEYCQKYIKGKTLDFGAGNAKYRDIIKLAADKYVTFDLIPGPNIDVVGDVLNSPFADNEFDTVISTQVLEHVEKPWLMIKEIARILKRGGNCILTVPFLVPYHPDPQDNFRFTREGLINMFKTEGFELVESGTYGGLFTVLSEFIHFCFFDPYKKAKFGSTTVVNFIQKIANLLDKLITNEKIYANSYIVAKRL
jgi:SAM-dependent methyltransferase